MFRLRVLPVLVISLLAAFVGLTISAFAETSGGDQLPAGPAKAVAAAACLTCHDSRIIVQQRLSKPAWVKEVDKMAKWGAAVDRKDREALIEYLSVNFPSDKPAYKAPISKAESIPKKKY